ncbi:hypothetical protein [Microcoleus vaginatus]|uniref:hypothetical protein n=1 Tax=Microcoleus vaginatus TaxID=119532 RepID=UPI001F60D4E4
MAPCQCFWPGADRVPWPNLLDRAARALSKSAASRHAQGLSQRVSVPGCPSTRLERDTGADRTRRIICLEQRVNTYSADKILSRAFSVRL